MTDAGVCDECGSRLDGTLHRLRTGRGVTAAQWLRAPAAGEPGHVFVDTRHVVVHGWRVPEVQVHGERSGPGVVVRARPDALPLPGRSVPALVVAPILPEFPDLDGLFAELRRVLRPHGLLTMLVPDGPPLGLSGRGLRGRVRASWAHRSAVDHPDWLLAAADFALMGDDRVVFHAPDVSEDPAAHVETLCAAGLLPHSLAADVRAELARQRSVRDGRVALRRLVARR